MRTFIAIPLPDELKIYLSGLQKNIREGKLSLTHEKHLTLKFLGEITDVQAEKVISKLGDIPFSPFVLTTGKMGVFPAMNRARVIWLGLKENESLKKLYEDIDESMSGLGFRREKNYVPHLTLARVKHIDDKASFGKMLVSIQTEPITFRVNSLVFFKSTLTPSGAVHEKLAELPKGSA